MFTQRPFSAAEAGGSGQRAVALGLESGSGCCWRGSPGSHGTGTERQDRSLEVTPPHSASPAARAALTDQRQAAKTDPCFLNEHFKQLCTHCS